MPPSGSVTSYASPTGFSSQSTRRNVVDCGILLVWKTSSGAQAAIRNCPPQQPTSTATPENVTGFTISAKSATVPTHATMRDPIGTFGKRVSERALGACASRLLSTTATGRRSAPAVGKHILSSWFLTTSMAVEPSSARLWEARGKSYECFEHKGFQKDTRCSARTAMRHSGHGGIALMRRRTGWPVDCQSGAGHRGPSMRPEAPTIPPALQPMPLAITSVGAQRSQLPA